MIEQLKAAVEDAKDRTATVVFYSGAVVDRYNWMRDEEYTLQFDLAGVDLARLNSGAPLLKDHMPMLDSVVGVSERAWVENGRCMATVRFSEREDVEPIWRDVQSRIVKNVSMGTYVSEMKDVTPRGVKKRAYMATAWEPREISLVAIGADKGASFLSGGASTREEFLALAAQRLTPADVEKPDFRDVALRVKIRALAERGRRRRR